VLETGINEWFAQHPKVQVDHVKHDVVTGLGVQATLIVSLYYTENAPS
jgi:hypothetical protein